MVSNIKDRIIKFSKKQFSAFVQMCEKTDKKRRAALLLVILSAAIILPSFPFSTLTLAYEVKLEDEVVGYVATEKEADKATALANKKVAGNVEEKVETTVKVVANDDIVDANTISKKIIKSDAVTDGYGIYADGVCVAGAKDKKTLEDALEQYKLDCLIGTRADVIVFKEQIEIKECVTTDTNTNEKDIVKALKKSLTKQLGFYQTKLVTTKHKTIKRNDSSIYKGTTRTSVYGKNGKAIQKSVVLYDQNDKKVDTIVLSKEVLQKKTDAVVLVGTKELPKVTAKGRYLWPVPSYSYVSSEYGYRSGRLHKGIDIIAPYGVDILAAANGTVTRASWYESYGYCIDIKHADGNTTRYAHCSSLNVAVGEQVVMGQVIGFVGSTGRSTANHLHFEVVSGGSYINPRSYITE